MLRVCLDGPELLQLLTAAAEDFARRDPAMHVGHVHDGEHDSSAEEGRRGPWDRHRDHFQTFGGENTRTAIQQGRRSRVRTFSIRGVNEGRSRLRGSRHQSRN